MIKKEKLMAAMCAAALAVSVAMTGCAGTSTASTASTSVDNGANASISEASGTDATTPSSACAGKTDAGFPGIAELCTAKSSKEITALLSEFPHKREKSGGYTTDLYASSEQVLSGALSSQSFNNIANGEWVLVMPVSCAGTADEYYTQMRLYIGIPGSLQDKLDVLERDFGLIVDEVSDDAPNDYDGWCHFEGGEEESVILRKPTDNYDVVRLEFYVS